MVILEKYLDFNVGKWSKLMVQIRYVKFEKTYKVYIVPCNVTSWGRETEAMSGITDSLLEVSRRSNSTDLNATEAFYKKEKEYLKHFKTDQDV